MRIFSRTEWLISIVLAVGLIQLTPVIGWYYASTTPVQEWIDVSKVYVTDTKLGDVVQVVVSRTIHQSFDGSYSVKVIRIDGDSRFPICDNSNDVHYTPKDGTIALTLDQYLSEACSLPTGLYIVETTWIVKREGYGDKSLTVESNPFKVFK